MVDLVPGWIWFAVSDCKVLSNLSAYKIKLKFAPRQVIVRFLPGSRVLRFSRHFQNSKVQFNHQSTPGMKITALRVLLPVLYVLSPISFANFIASLQLFSKRSASATEIWEVLFEVKFDNLLSKHHFSLDA
jgi:hypothetical protein